MAAEGEGRDIIVEPDKPALSFSPCGLVLKKKKKKKRSHTSFHSFICTTKRKQITNQTIESWAGLALFCRGGQSRRTDPVRTLLIEEDDTYEVVRHWMRLPSAETHRTILLRANLNGWCGMDRNWVDSSGLDFMHESEKGKVNSNGISTKTMAFGYESNPSATSS